MYVRVHDRKDGRIIAVCDKVLIGKVFQEGDKIIDLKTYKDFYVGELSDEETVSNILKGKFSSANIVGKKSVAVAIKFNIAQKNNVLTIKDIPYLHIYVF